MSRQLLYPSEVDRVLRFPSGRARRLALEGFIPYVQLPKGEVRFDPDVFEEWLAEQAVGAEQFVTTEDGHA